MRNRKTALNCYEISKLDALVAALEGSRDFVNGVEIGSRLSQDPRHPNLIVMN